MDGAGAFNIHGHKIKTMIHDRSHFLSHFKTIVSMLGMWVEVARVVRRSPLPCPPSVLSPSGGLRRGLTVLCQGGASPFGCSLRELPTLPNGNSSPDRASHCHASFVAWDLVRGRSRSPEVHCTAGTWEGNAQSSSVAVGWELLCPAAQTSSGRCRRIGESR